MLLKVVLNTLLKVKPVVKLEFASNVFGYNETGANLFPKKCTDLGDRAINYNMLFIEN